MGRTRGLWKRLVAAAALPALLWSAQAAAGPAPHAVGAPAPNVQCPPGYQATIYASGLTSPDGLAFGPDGALYVAEELAGRVSRVVDGTPVPVLEGLQHPEGIAFDSAGNLYAVEDVRDGRVVRRAPDGTQTVIARNRDAPEGIVVRADSAIFITESNVEFAASLSGLQTHVTQIAPGATPTRIITDTAPMPTSFSELAVGLDGLLYVANELSGEQYGGFTVPDSIYTVDPNTGEQHVFARNLHAPEGLRFNVGGGFPLYVAEEADGAGRLSQVAADGSSSVLCSGFGSIEAVILNTDGQLFVSEDSSGSIIKITPPTKTPPSPTPIGGAQRLFLPLVRR